MSVGITTQRFSERDAQLFRLLRLGVLTAALTFFVAWTTTDPDLWGHVRFGGDIVATRALPSVDPYSFTSDRPWINHEWLAEVFIYSAYAAAGSAGLVLLKVSIVAGMIWCVVASLRHSQWLPLRHDLLIGVVLIATFPRYHPVRPQLFSLLLFAALLLMLMRADRNRPRALLGIPPLFAAWANLHGGYIVGLAVLATWLTVRIIETPRRWRALTGLGAAAVLATLVTPYGIRLWLFLQETVGFSREMADWQPAWSAGPLFVLFWAVSVSTAVAALWRARGRVDPAGLAIVLMLALATVRVNRIDAFFGIAVVMLLGSIFGRAAEQPQVPRLPWRSWTIATAGIIVITVVALLGRDRSCIALAHVPEREASSVLREHHGRLLTHFSWGEYAIWHFAPALRVSMDGRRETVYSDALTDAHLRFYKGTSTTLVDELKPDVIWLPASLPVLSVLEREGWHVAFRGSVSVILTRDTHSGTVDVTRSAGTGPRCFPGD